MEETMDLPPPHLLNIDQPRSDCDIHYVAMSSLRSDRNPNASGEVGHELANQVHTESLEDSAATGQQPVAPAGQSDGAAGAGAAPHKDTVTFGGWKPGQQQTSGGLCLEELDKRAQRLSWRISAEEQSSCPSCVTCSCTSGKVCSRRQFCIYLAEKM
eukprot:TRINITY_DN5174_c0_g1_i1.p1 TRINITY_DN5174_c0_g1~~TRINITY_DN5174_c0_g1_i1.p1  ORF type:complete len:177 (-),score=17.95 TRINITY_DN5174_c0_g1_i1:57-527(-)